MTESAQSDAKMRGARQPTNEMAATAAETRLPPLTTFADILNRRQNHAIGNAARYNMRATALVSLSGFECELTLPLSVNSFLAVHTIL